jgi:hypothetical protein
MSVSVNLSTYQKIKSINGKWNGVDTPVLAETHPDGTMTLDAPPNCPPDTLGYNRNCVFQMERKTKMAARLRAKLYDSIRK